MTITVRRVVTGHNDQGKAIVSYDEISDNAISKRDGQSGTVIWTTDRSPADNTGDGDEAKRKVYASLPNGSIGMYDISIRQIVVFLRLGGHGLNKAVICDDRVITRLKPGSQR